MRRLFRSLFSFVCVAVIVGAAIPVHAQIEPGMLDETDFFGEDIARVDLAEPLPRLCRDACEGNINCRAWTFVRPGFFGPNAVCYLKSPAPQAEPNPCCISGMAVREASAPTANRLNRFMVETGDTATINSQSSVALSAQCRDGRIALAAGYRIAPANFGSQAEFGLEPKTVTPDGDVAIVRIKNGTVGFDPVTVTAVVTCIRPPPRISVQRTVSTSEAACPFPNSLMGGGIAAPFDYLIQSSGPVRTARDTVGRNQMAEGRWRTIFASPSPQSLQGVTTTTMCTANGLLGSYGLEAISSPAEIVIEPRSIVSQTLSCPNGKTVISAGFTGSGPDNSATVSESAPGPGPGQWTVRIANRNTFGGLVRGFVSGICADTAP